MSASATALRFEATNVTGTQQLPFALDPQMPVSSVTDSIAQRMALPDDVAWGLRDDESSAYLDESRPIGEQIEPGARLSITPRTHLGGLD